MHLYDQTLQHMERTVTNLATRVESPKAVPFRDSFVYRYTEKTLHQALVMKLVRVISGLHAARLLQDAGFIQEQAVLHRVIDELTEDVLFLSLSVISGETTKAHETYLEAFYQEEFDPNDETLKSSERRMVPRKKIRAYIHKFSGVASSTQHLDASRTVAKTYSGFVHAASPQIMEIFGGHPPRFHMRGMKGTQRQAEYSADLWNYFHRGILAFACAAKAFGDETLFASIRGFSDEFSRLSGKNYQSAEWENI